MRDKNIRAFRARWKSRMSMRAAVLALSVGCGFFLTGCWATKPAFDFATITTFSVKGDTWQKWFPLTFSHPFYFKSDVVFLPELLGAWNHDEKNIGAIFVRRGRRGYRITFTGKDGETTIKGQLVRLGGELYLELRWPTGRARRIGRIRIDGGVLRMATLRHRLKKYIYINGFWIGLPASDIVDGSKKKLRKHFIDTADEYFSFEEDDFLRRVSPPEGGKSKIDGTESAGGKDHERKQ